MIAAAAWTSGTMSPVSLILKCGAASLMARAVAIERARANVALRDSEPAGEYSGFAAGLAARLGDAFTAPDLAATGRAGLFAAPSAEAAGTAAIPMRPARAYGPTQSAILLFTS